MDTSRLSIARLLELDVPFDWQDAVAVVQEVAMLSDVHAAMYNRPSLVTAEHCFITRSGAVELPETTDSESPEAVPELLRALLAGREAPEALEDLAFGMATRDMSGELAAFPVGNRRAVIAKLAARALTAMNAPPTAGASAMAGAVTAAPQTFAPDAGEWPVPESAGEPSTPAVAPAPPNHVRHAVSLARETFRPVLVQPAARQPPPAPDAAVPGATLSPPFIATPPFVAGPPTPAPVASSPSDIELERLRRRTTTRVHGAGWGARFAAAVSWRPSFPDPRVIGSAAIVTAAIVSMVWSSTSSPTAPTAPSVAPALGSAPAAASGARATVATGPAEAPGVARAEGTGRAAAPPVAPPSAARASNPTPAPSSPPARPLTAPAASSSSPRMAAATASDTTPRIALPTASRPPALEPLAGGPPSAATAAPPVEPSAATTAAIAAPAAIPAGDARTSRPAVPFEPDAPADALYTSGDAGVVPPVIRRQHLPSNLVEPQAEVPEDWPYLELLIDARGAVEQVRLHARQLAPGQTLYRHRMLLAAAKAWQFEPARRNGEAVRYLMRVPLEP